MAPRALYVPHGGGPLPLFGHSGHAEMIAYLSSIEGEIGRPSAIVLISAHWEHPAPAITAHPNPGLYFDYFGFPQEAYEYGYPAVGSPELAERIATSLRSAGFDPLLDTERGFDHGMFVPLLLMYPDAGIPVVQVSLVAGLDAHTNIAMGEAIGAALESGIDGPVADDVLVLGSGMSFHNQRAFGIPDDPGVAAFDQWLEATCTDAMPEDERRARLLAWEDAPAARHNHPREEHLLPLHVCYGVARSAATRTFDGQVLGTRVAAYAWN